jgi:hypothetical protein
LFFKALQSKLNPLEKKTRRGRETKKNKNKNRMLANKANTDGSLICLSTSKEAEQQQPQPQPQPQQQHHHHHHHHQQQQQQQRGFSLFFPMAMSVRESGQNRKIQSRIERSRARLSRTCIWSSSAVAGMSLSMMSGFKVDPLAAINRDNCTCLKPIASDSCRLHPTAADCSLLRSAEPQTNEMLIGIVSSVLN